MTGVPKSTVSAIRNGRVPKIDILEQIAEGLELYIEDLYASPLMRCPESGTDIDEM